MPLRNSEKPRCERVTTMRWYGVCSAWTTSSVYSCSSKSDVIQSPANSPPRSSAATNTARTRSRVTPGSTASRSQVLHRPTSALSRPKRSEVRTRPSLGTRTMGNRSDADQRAQVVEGQHPRHEILELQLVLQDAQQQGNLQAHQGAHHQHHAVEGHAERRASGEGGEEEGRRDAASQRPPPARSPRSAGPRPCR